MVEKGIPRHDYLIEDAGGNPIGKVTSGTMSPVLGIGIGMGYVMKSHTTPETEIFINVRGKAIKAQVSKLPLI
jgi:aminomethyltransferase